jgi:hypothetical protein
MNRLITRALEEFKGKEEQWWMLSQDTSVKEEYIEKHLDKPWDWRGLSHNHNISQEFIEKHLHKEWDWTRGVSRNRNITQEFIRKHSEKEWDWYVVAHHPNVNKEERLMSDFKEKYEKKRVPTRERLMMPAPFGIVCDMLDKIFK